MTAPIRRRTRAREIAVQVLFQFDLRGRDYAAELGGTIEELCRAELIAGPEGDGPQGDGPGDNSEPPSKLGAADREVVQFAARLVDGALEHRDAIDQRLQSVTRNWDLKRMAIVDRNVLRMAVFELLHCDDVPPKVAINEAIEIGKKFSTANSGGFVNGILDRIRIDIERERRGESGEAANEA